MKLQEKEMEMECPKCKTKATVKANNMFDRLYSCQNCGEVIVVKKIIIK